MITSVILTRESLSVVFDNNTPKMVRKDQANWSEALEAYKANDETRLRNAIDAKAVMEKYSNGDLTIDGTGILYRGRPLHGVDVDRVLAFQQGNLPYEPLANFMSRKMANTSQRAIQELYPWLEHRNISLTPSGKFIGYKGVRSDFYSVRGNTETVVLQGVVNSDGHILNEIGQTIEVLRSCVSDDFRNPCGPGLHVGSLSYAMGWGQRCMLVEVDPADVVSVPTDCDCQKLRVCKYKVIGEYAGPLPDTYTPEFDGEEEVCPQCGETESECCCESEGSDGVCGCLSQDPSEETCECQVCNCQTSANPIEQAAQDAGILPGGVSETEDAYEDDYLNGMKDGIEDKAIGKEARFLAGDQEGADSPRHAAFIDGYVNGYN